MVTEGIRCSRFSLGYWKNGVVPPSSILEPNYDLGGGVTDHCWFAVIRHRTIGNLRTTRRARGHAATHVPLAKQRSREDARRAKTAPALRHDAGFDGVGWSAMIRYRTIGRLRTAAEPEAPRTTTIYESPHGRVPRKPWGRNEGNVVS